MLPEFACNLKSTLSFPPWRKGLRWGLYTTKEWEQRSPFHSYVHSSAEVTRVLEKASLFPQFGALPSELQFRILALCSARTLFQIMHVSSALRVEASKLFWAKPNAFFLVEADWLLEGGYSGYTHWDISFLHHVQKVEIEYRPGTDSTICLYEDGRVLVQQNLITAFWKSFTQRFPNAKQVVINQNWETPLWWKDKEPVAQPLRMLIQSCPPGIDTAAFVLERSLLSDDSTTIPPTQRWRRALYQPVVGGGWAESCIPWHRTTVLMPTKSFRGSVGEFQRLALERGRILGQKHGLWPLMIEALDRHHFDDGQTNPFTCPSFDCSAYFSRAGEWSAHAVEFHCQEWIAGEPMALLPSELRSTFERQENALEEKQEIINQQYQKLYEQWNKGGWQKQEEIERSWMGQLENDTDWDTGSKAGESRLWAEYLQQMNPTSCSPY